MDADLKTLAEIVGTVGLLGCLAGAVTLWAFGCVLWAGELMNDLQSRNWSGAVLSAGMLAAGGGLGLFAFGGGLYALLRGATP